MSSKLNIQDAKLKILKLKEKYSKSTNFKTDFQSFSSSPNKNHTSSYAGAQQQAIEQKGFVVEPKAHLSEGNHILHKKISTGHSQLNVDSGLQNQSVVKEAVHINTIISGKSASSQPYLNNTLSTESSTISSIAHQLEQLCFLSSSSYDHIVKQGDIHRSETPHSSDITEELLQSKSVLLQQHLSESNNGKLKVMPFEKENDDILEKSTTYSPYISEVCSVEEMSSASEKSSTKYDNSFNNTGKSQINKLKKEESGYKNISMSTTDESRTNSELATLKSNLFSITEMKSKAKMENLDNQKSVGLQKIIRNMCEANNEEVNDNQKVTKFKADFNSNSSDSSGLARNENFDSGSERSKVRDEVGWENSDSSRKCDLGRCRSSPRKKKSKTPSTRYGLYIAPSLKRPMVKSCKLIKYIETNEEDFNILAQTAMSRYCTLEDTFQDEKGTGMSCDEVIRKLLKCQIQLTRHFIESHHQMYLHCCQAVKTLSENHSVPYTLPP